MVRGVRGSAFNQRSGEVYVNPNPSNNRRGGSREKPVSEYYGPGGNPDGSGESQARQTSQTTVPSTPPEGSPGDDGGKSQEVPLKIGKQRSASNKNNKFGQLRYPYAILKKETDYLQIEILKYKTLGITPQENVLQQGVNSNKRNYNNTKKEDQIGTVILPIPQNITSTNSTGWGEDSLNTLAAYGLGAVNDTITNESLFGGIASALNQSFTDLKGIAKSGEGQQLSNAFFGSKAVNILGANTSFSGVLARSTGQILNPNTELLFNGVKLRSFNFSFNLAPRNGTEAKEIKKIIIELKRNMAPTSTIAEKSDQGGTGLFLKSPNVFRLKYKTGNNDHKFLNSFIVAALTNVQVNYTGSGTYMTYNDDSKTPVHMVMQLSFQELSPIYAEDYDAFGNYTDGYIGGVGY